MPSLTQFEKNVDCKKLRRSVSFFLIFFTLILGASFFSSCSSHSEGASLTRRLDEVDAFIQAGDTGEAVRLLKEASKEAFSAYARIGIYRRYMLLGETESAEKTLVKGLKKLPQNEELSAVYANFLLRRNRLLEAARVAKCLEGTAYGSLYSEAVLRLVRTGSISVQDALNAPKKIKNDKKHPVPALTTQTFKDPVLIPLYADAWKAGRDWKWLSNAVTLLMLEGDTTNAVALKPKTLESMEEKLLWALVLYDSGLYADSLQVLSGARESLVLTPSSLTTLSSSSLADREKVATYLELCALLSDVYYILGSDDASEEERSILISSLTNINESLLPENFRATVLPLVYLNSISHARMQNEPVREYELLSYALKNFPSNRNVLAAFGQFALDTAARPPEDELLTQLRQAGLRTQKMEADDLVPAVALEEALSYIDASLKKSRDVPLVVLREELRDASSLTDRAELKASRVWLLLEQEETGTNTYPPEVLSYALSRLINCGFYDEAHQLFNRCMTASYGKDFIPSEEPQLMELWELEYAAYFEGTSGSARNSRRLYSYIADHFADRAAVMHSTGQNETVVNALVNLALIQASTGEEKLAVETLNMASGKTASIKTKAEILYRLAVLHKGLGDSRNAQRSLQYALTLNPSLGKAHLLQKELQK